jgi:hypothetical protein
LPYGIEGNGFTQKGARTDFVGVSRKTFAA